MEIKEFTNYEVVGLANTISEYSRDNYIRNYSKILIESAQSGDFGRLEGVVIRLLNWYKSTIEEIRNDKYLYNKQQHEKSLQLLESVNDEIQKGKHMK